MNSRPGVAIAATAIVVAAALAASSGAASPNERPRGLLLDCSTQSGRGGGLRQFTSRWNLVVGPLAMRGATGPEPDRVSLEPFGGDKFQVYLKGGHRVTLELPRVARRGAGLVYGQRPSGRYGYRVITFVACQRGESESEGRSTAEGWPVSFWAGGILARSPRCVPLRIWVDDESSPRSAVIKIGVSSCN
jgi:hypothetical protein